MNLSPLALFAALNFQRRHGRKCSAGHPADSFTTETEERRRGTKKCACPIYVSGTLGGLSHKLGTKQPDWDMARAIVEPYVVAGCWIPAGPPVQPPPTLTPTPGGGKGMAISSAVDSCLQSQKANHAAEATQKKYRDVLRGKEGLENFAQARGLRFLEEFRPRLIRELVESWDVSQGSRRTKLSVLKPFFEMFVEDGVLDTNPARINLRRNRALRESEEPQARLAFSNEELQRMLDGCGDFGQTEVREWPKKKGGRQVVAISERREYARKFDGVDVADFIEISYNTGLRFMDVAKFHIDRLTRQGEVKLRAGKNNTWVCVLVPEYLQQVIRNRARQFGPYIFGDPKGRTDHSVYQCWRKRLEALWEQEGPWEYKPIHHRFRHTFVRQLLERDASVSVVAHLIGDSEETVRKHYSNWVPELQAHISDVLQQIQAQAPRFRRGA